MYALRSFATTCFLLVISLTLVARPSVAENKQPNIVLIYADDLGYGDLSCYNPESKVSTPVLDRLAADGVRFTDAHSPATVCTPSRYSLMTGQMRFRSKRRGGVFSGVGGPSLIAENQLTLPSMLRQQGYSTACVGKWHIGLTFQTKDSQPVLEQPLKHKRGIEKHMEMLSIVDYSKPIPDGPINHGFDYFYGTACCPTTDWLYAYIEGDKVTEAPTKQIDRTKLPDHPYSVDCREGMIAPNFDLELVDMVFLDKSKKWLEDHVSKTPEKPFFLYHAMQAVHLPSFPAPEFQGKSGAGPHGDFIVELDTIVGRLVEKLETLGVANNTLIIISSDNGPETIPVIHMRTDHNHDPAHPWRGVKRDAWEGGHRVPLIVHWPGKLRKGTVDTTVNLTDIFATCAAAIDTELPEDAAQDSFSFLSDITGVPDDLPRRDYTLQQASGRQLSIRRGQWKYLDHKGSGGNNYAGKEMGPYALPETAPDAPGQLYNLDEDPGETNNLYFSHPEVVKELKGLLDTSKKVGRTVPLGAEPAKEMDKL